MKQIKPNTKLTELQLKEFLAEASLMRLYSFVILLTNSNMRSHRNVVGLMGMCTTPLCIVTGKIQIYIRIVFTISQNFVNKEVLSHFFKAIVKLTIRFV